GSVLGKTPWESARSAGLGQLAVKLRLAGYAERDLSLDLASDCIRSEVMVATGVAPVAPPPESLAARPEPAGEKGKKGKKDNNSATEAAPAAGQSGQRYKEE